MACSADAALTTWFFVRTYSRHFLGKPSDPNTLAEARAIAEHLVPALVDAICHVAWLVAEQADVPALW